MVQGEGRYRMVAQVLSRYSDVMVVGLDDPSGPVDLVGLAGLPSSPSSPHSHYHRDSDSAVRPCAFVPFAWASYRQDHQ